MRVPIRTFFGSDLPDFDGGEIVLYYRTRDGLHAR